MMKCIACNENAEIYVAIKGIGAAFCEIHYGGVGREIEETALLWPGL